MRYDLAIPILFLSAALGAAQTSGATRPATSPSAGSLPSSSSSAAPNLDAILDEIQQATRAAGTDISRLRIDRWKADSTEKAQLQQVADSLHKNITNAVPDLIGEARSSQGGVSSTFKLYHNINVVFEYLNSLTDAAASLGKKEEYDPLNSDTAALDKSRQHLSDYIARAAVNLEDQLRAALATPTPTPAPPAPPKKIVVDDETSKKKPANTKKKKTSTPPAQPSATPN